MGKAEIVLVAFRSRSWVWLLLPQHKHSVMSPISWFCCLTWRFTWLESFQSTTRWQCSCSAAGNAQSLFRSENQCTSPTGTACVPHAHSIAASQSSENLSSWSPWRLVMNLPLAGLVVLCYSAGVQVERRAGFAEGNWETAKLALNIFLVLLGRQAIPG